MSIAKSARDLLLRSYCRAEPELANDETGEVMPSPICRAISDPKFRDLAVNDVSNFAEQFGAANPRRAVCLIHGVHVHATIALP